MIAKKKKFVRMLNALIIMITIKSMIAAIEKIILIVKNVTRNPLRTAKIFAKQRIVTMKIVMDIQKKR
jgi:hypothetical protein